MPIASVATSAVFLIGTIFAASAVGAGATRSGPMLSAGIYEAFLDDRLGIDRDDLEELTFDGSSLSFNLGVGYRINQWFAVDAGYWDLGNYESDRDEAGDREKFDATSWALGVLLTWPIGSLDLYARGGAAFWEYDGRNIDGDGTDPYYGAGFAFNLSENFGLYAEWIRFDLGTNIDAIGLGFRWTFSM